MTRYCLTPRLRSVRAARRVRVPRDVTPLCMCRACSMSRHPSAGQDPQHSA